MIFLLALVLNGFTNSFGMSTHGQLTVAEQEAVEAFREADVDHSGTLSKAEVVQHFNEEQAEVPHPPAPARSGLPPTQERSSRSRQDGPDSHTPLRGSICILES